MPPSPDAHRVFQPEDTTGRGVADGGANQQPVMGNQASCTNCGAETRSEARFCGRCGAQVGNSTPPAVPEHRQPAEDLYLHIGMAAGLLVIFVGMGLAWSDVGGPMLFCLCLGIGLALPCAGVAVDAYRETHRF